MNEEMKNQTEQLPLLKVHMMGSFFLEYGDQPISFRKTMATKSMRLLQIFLYNKVDGTGSWAVGDWPESSTGGGFITVVQGKSIEVNSNTTATDISEKTPMLNIPQKLTAWKVSEEATNTKMKADGAHQCYLSITCKIQQSGGYLLGSADSYGTIYVPFGDTWVAGKRHIYTLIFGGGYTDQGEAVLNPIQFDAETTGWVDADKDVNVQPQP